MHWSDDYRQADGNQPGLQFMGACHCMRCAALGLAASSAVGPVPPPACASPAHSLPPQQAPLRAQQDVQGMTHPRWGLQGRPPRPRRQSHKEHKRRRKRRVTVVAHKDTDNNNNKDDVVHPRVVQPARGARNRSPVTKHERKVNPMMVIVTTA